MYDLCQDSQRHNFQFKTTRCTYYVHIAYLLLQVDFHFIWGIPQNNDKRNESPIDFVRYLDLAHIKNYPFVFFYLLIEKNRYMYK